MSQISRQKAEYVSHNPGVVKAGSPYVELVYKRLDGEEPGKLCTTGAFVAQLDEDSKKQIKAGGQFVVVKTKGEKYWNLTKVEPISTWVDKPVSGGFKSYSNKQTGGSSYNTAGIKVGAVLHDAVALYTAVKNDNDIYSKSTALENVKVIAEDLLTLSYELEANVNAGKYEPSKSQSNNSQPINEHKPEETKTDDFSNIEW